MIFVYLKAPLISAPILKGKKKQNYCQVVCFEWFTGVPKSVPETHIVPRPIKELYRDLYGANAAI